MTLTSLIALAKAYANNGEAFCGTEPPVTDEALAGWASISVDDLVRHGRDTDRNWGSIIEEIYSKRTRGPTQIVLSPAEWEHYLSLGGEVKP